MAASIAPGRRKAFGLILSGSSIPLPTQPASRARAANPCARRPFSSTNPRASKLGMTPLSLPPGVEISMGEIERTISKSSFEEVLSRNITVKGPLGSLSLKVPDFLQVEQDAASRTAQLSVRDANKDQQKAMWGTTWSYLRNYIMGVSEGHTAIMRLVGVGYRASVEDRGQKQEFRGQKFLCLKLGFTHPVEEGIPRGVTVTTPNPTRILLEGMDKEAIMSFAGRVRKWRPPEPYKGKGIFINDQTIKLKNKKIK